MAQKFESAVPQGDSVEKPAEKISEVFTANLDQVDNLKLESLLVEAEGRAQDLEDQSKRENGVSLLSKGQEVLGKRYNLQKDSQVELEALLDYAALQQRRYEMEDVRAKHLSAYPKDRLYAWSKIHEAVNEELQRRARQF